MTPLERAKAFGKLVYAGKEGRTPALAALSGDVLRGQCTDPERWALHWDYAMATRMRKPERRTYGLALYREAVE